MNTSKVMEKKQREETETAAYQNILLDNNRRQQYIINLKVSEDRYKRPYSSGVGPVMNAKSGDDCYFGNQSTMYLNYSRIGGKSKRI